MSDSPSPRPSGTVKLTRTGRISKAAKGQRVHHCEDCGKTYTRAEHLRRHQQNHKPGAYPCDVHGCGRAFYREDLLTRHKQRHECANAQDSHLSNSSHTSDGDPSPRRTSRSRSLSQARSRAPRKPGVVQEQLVYDINSSRSREGISSNSHSQAIDESDHLSVQHLPLRVAGNNDLLPVAIFDGPWGSNPPPSPLVYSSILDNAPPTSIQLPYYSTYEVEPGAYIPTNEHISPYDLGDIPDSPQSVSQRGYPDSWRSNSVSHPFVTHEHSNRHESPSEEDSSLSIEARSEKAFDMLPLRTIPQQFEPIELDVAHTMLMTYDAVDQVLLEISPESSDRFYHAFWSRIHTTFPVTNRAGMIWVEPCSLRNAAMQALGASSLGNISDMALATTIYDASLKSLYKIMQQPNHRLSMGETCAVLLIEIFTLFKARRATTRPSKCFLQVYAKLASKLHDGFLAYFTAALMGEFQGITTSAPADQELLMAFYTFDKYRAIVCGQACSPTSSMLDDSIVQICSHTDLHWLSSASIPSTGAVGSNYGAKNTVDAFLDSPLAIAAMTGAFEDNPELSWLHHHVYERYQQTATSEQMLDTRRLKFQALDMCRQTPLRSLLAVTGESWIVSEKMEFESDFSAAQHDMRQWIDRGFSDGSKSTLDVAFEHAIAIIRLQQHQVPCSGVIDEWAGYLAVLVIWAKFFSPSLRSQRWPKLSISIPHASSRSVRNAPTPDELARALGVLQKPDNGEAVTWKHVRTVILWQISRMSLLTQSHQCGLMSCAVDVLTRLAERGHEMDMWFN